MRFSCRLDVASRRRSWMLSPSIPLGGRSNRHAVFTHCIFSPVSFPNTHTLAGSAPARIVSKHLERCAVATTERGIDGCTLRMGLASDASCALAGPDGGRSRTHCDDEPHSGGGKLLLLLPGE